MMTLTTVSSSATAEDDERCSQRPVQKQGRGHHRKASMILRSNPSRDVAPGLVGVGAVDRVHEQRLAIGRDVDRQRAGRQRDQVGEQRDLEIAVDLQPVGEDARLQVHARREHQPGDAVAGEHELVGEQHGQAGNAQRADRDFAAPRCSRAKDDARTLSTRPSNALGIVNEPVSASQASVSRTMPMPFFIAPLPEIPRRHRATVRSARPPHSGRPR